ncbi:hypothetical protein DPMN_072834 [Dreissena polymorpha]|uniref:Uncharacterized protein n=1 Tax=Dreissena polymorpha TaxID=45954 RepID=A0A9D4HC44_DREPO|nr:hypothetical protein DPMN_072834 [Dreissena polymorpha]
MIAFARARVCVRVCMPVKLEMAEGAKQSHVPGTDRTPGCNILISSRISEEDASFELSNILNMLGYGKELRQKRRECHRQCDINFNALLPCDFEIITVGSKAEGTSRFFESDRDVLLVCKSIHCIEAACDVDLIPENTDVFRMGTLRCYPGHCILLRERGFSPLLYFAGYDNGHGEVLLSSEYFLNILTIQVSSFFHTSFFHKRSGPSLPYTFGGQDVDAVFALRCRCPSILQNWAARSRHWPPPDIVAKVVSMGAFLTPVGFKEAKIRFLNGGIASTQVR